MNHKALLYTKRRLTIIFTILVFCVAMLLQTIFFSIKYMGVLNGEKENMNVLSTRFQQSELPISDLIHFFRPERKFLSGGQKDTQQYQENMTSGKMMNFILLDKNNLVVAQDIKNDIDLKVVENIFNGGLTNMTIDSGMILSVINVNTDYTLILFKNMRYSFADYIADIAYFTIVIFLFSVLFYYIGFQFVSQNLKPVEDTLEDMHDFIQNAGHELKTPIAVIDSNLQIMRQTKQFEAGMIQEGLNEIHRLNHLIESLIELSNINSVQTQEKLSLSHEIQVIIKEFSGEADKKKIHIVCDIKNEKSLLMNRQYFYILFSNLLGNAIKYTQKSGQINITLDKHFFSVRDNGPGISKNHKDKIFDRFYQVDNSRSGIGFGIGLSLVKKIVDIYKFKITVKSEEGQGSEFIVEFKKHLT